MAARVRMLHGAMNEIVAETVRDRREGAHAAWRDHHPERHKRSAGDRRSLIAAAVTLRS